jgi:hypothetical protein
VQLFIHTVSWPFVFLLGVSRWNPPNSLSDYIAGLETRLSLLPAGWPQVVVAVMLWAVTGALVRLGRTLLHTAEDGRN